MERVDRWIFAFALWILLAPHTAAGQRTAGNGNDHVVRPCPAQPYTGVDFHQNGFAPIDVLNTIRTSKAAEGNAAAKVVGAKAYIVHVAEWTEAPPPVLAGSTATTLQARLTRSEWAGFDYKGAPSRSC